MKQTLENLAKAFAGESQARNRYTMYSNIARKEGFEQIAEIFQMTADNEFEHGEWFFKFIQQLKKSAEDMKIDADVPTTFGKTAENLKAAIAGEHHENSELYPEFANVAEKEGLAEIAKRIRAISKAEEHHEERYKKLLKELEAGTLFKKDKPTQWVCRKCGYVHEGKEPPETCPACNHAKNFYQIKCEVY